MKLKSTLFILSIPFLFQSSCFADDFSVEEGQTTYLDKPERSVTLTYSGSEHYKGIWGGDLEKGGTMAIVSEPTKSVVIISDNDAHKITYYSSPDSREHTPQNKIYEYDLKAK